jgi:hypothetical protein
MAELKKPDNKSKGKGLPPKEIEVSLNLHKTPTANLKPLNFKVEPEFHRTLKALAVEKELSMVALLKEMYEKYTSY